MSKENSDTGPLFEEILSSSLRPEQVARWRKGGESPTYKLLRDPVSLEELNQHGHTVAIWRENGTLTYVSPRDTDDFPDRHDRSFLCLEFEDEDLSLSIFGITDDAIAQTAAFLLEMKGPTQETSHLLVTADDDFNFRAVELQELPSRNVQFQRLTLSAAQCIVLATQPHPGAAFVDALQNRESSFGSLMFEREDAESIALGDDNVKRLLQVDVLEHLSLPSFDEEIEFLPFSAKVGSLTYDISSSSILEAAWQSLNIETTKLFLSIYAEESLLFPTDFVLAFWRRVAVLGHFEELGVRCYDAIDIPDCVVQAIIHAALSNPSLKVLDLWDCDLDWTPHLKTLFSGIKDHQALRTIKIQVSVSHDEGFGPEYSHLRELLSYHRNIRVTNLRGELYSDRLHVDALYSLNRFYQDSANLAVDPPLERPLLMATALIESASNDFQRSALLMSDHIDALIEVVHFEQLDEIDAGESPLKKRRIQPPRAAKRTTRLSS